MSTISSLKQQCILRIESALKKWNTNQTTQIVMPKIVWNTRLSTTAGRASTDIRNKTGIIELSTKLLQLNNAEFVNDTPIHELGHIVANVSAKRLVGHSKYFYQVCSALGHTNPTRCHNMTTKTSVTRAKLNNTSVNDPKVSAVLRKFNLPITIIGTKVTTCKLGVCEVIEIHSSRPKYPIIVADKQGRKMKLTPHQYKMNSI